MSLAEAFALLAQSPLIVLLIAIAVAACILARRA